MRSIARLLKVARELPLELASVPSRRLLALPLVIVPLSGSCTSWAKSRHTCGQPLITTGFDISWSLCQVRSLTQ